MTHVKVCCWFATVFLFLSGAVAHERTWPAKRLQTTWPEVKKFSSKKVNLSPSQIKHLQEDGIKMGVEDRSPGFYLAQEKDKKTGIMETLGVIIFIDEYGANGKMEISVGMSAGGKVKKLHIWEHSEDKRVARKEFLGQFIGKSHTDSFEPGEGGYTPVEGAEKASEAVSRAVEKALAITQVVFGKGVSTHAEESHGDHKGEEEHHGDSHEESEKSEHHDE